MGENMKNHLSSRKLEKCAKKASILAIKRAQTLKIAYTAQDGKNIVEHLPDGSKRIVGTLENAFVKPSGRRFRVA